MLRTPEILRLLSIFIFHLLNGTPSSRIINSAIKYFRTSKNHQGCIITIYSHIQGEQKSPGVIPLAVKDVFGIIQEVIQ